MPNKDQSSQHQKTSLGIELNWGLKHQGLGVEGTGNEQAFPHAGSHTEPHMVSPALIWLVSSAHPSSTDTATLDDLREGFLLCWPGEG